MRARDALMPLLLAAAPALAAEPAFRHEAAIVVEQPGAFVRLPLPPSVYARSEQGGLADLRVVDARGERVPFALQAPKEGELQRRERLRDATLYPLPRRPAGNAIWPLPVEVVVEGDRIAVKRSGAALPADARSPSPGWLIDLGERRRDEPPPQSLRLAWSGPTEFSAGYRIEHSDDLRQWRPGGGGQLMALASAAGPLAQPLVPLPSGASRFVRLVWADAGAAPALSGVQSVFDEATRSGGDAPTIVEIAAGAAADAKLPKAALSFDLGGVLPLSAVDLRLPPGNRVLPVRLLGRQRDGEAWRELAPAVFYRVERDGEVNVPPPLALAATLRFVAVVPDERAAPLDAAGVHLLAHARLGSLVFAAQGSAPFTLRAGATGAAPGALPIQTLVPALDTEAARFGRATLADWHEIAAVAQAEDAARQRAALRPWLLWAVLLGGVALLGALVWRLARGRPTSA